MKVIIITTEHVLHVGTGLSEHLRLICATSSMEKKTVLFFVANAGLSIDQLYDEVGSSAKTLL